MKFQSVVSVGLLLAALSIHTSPLLADGPVYVPPNVDGVPDRLVGGASRSNVGVAPTLAVLAPQEPGWTSQPQPVLYWYISQDINTPITLSITDMAGVMEGKAPVLDIQLDAAQAGIQKLDLQTLQVKLESGVEYEWSIAFSWPPEENVNSDTERSIVLTRATLMRKDPAETLARQVNQAKPEKLPSIYAQSGFWYDSLAALEDLITQQPEKTVYQNWRAALLQQEALDTLVATP
jgi:hypothetical protein